MSEPSPQTCSRPPAHHGKPYLTLQYALDKHPHQSLSLQPRPTRARTSLPGHSRAPTAAKQQDDLPPFNPADNDSMMLDISAPVRLRLAHVSPTCRLRRAKLTGWLAFPQHDSSAAEPSLLEAEEKRPPTKQKKADKLYARREALLASA